MKAGVAVADISPEKGVGLAGFPHEPRPNRGVHDPLTANVLYLNDGCREFALVTLDLLFFGKELVSELRNRLGMPLMFCASHTHSGPWASEAYPSEIREGIRPDEKYLNALKDRIERAVRSAKAEVFDATFAVYSGRCGAEMGVGGNRRDPNGPTDPSVNGLAVRDSAGTLRAVLVNYALHPTFLHAANHYVSADYPGYIRRFFRLAEPNAAVLFALGPSGNQSPRYFRLEQSFEEAARVGTLIGAEAARAVREASFESDLRIRFASEEIELPFKTFPSLEEAEAAVRRARENYVAKEQAGPTERWNAQLLLYGAENTRNCAELAASGFQSRELPFEISLFSPDDRTVFVGLQGEIFTEYGLEIKEKSPFERTFVFSVTNGSCPGYVYTPEAAAEGGYEVGTSMLAPEAGRIIANRAAEMLRRFREERIS